MKDNKIFKLTILLLGLAFLYVYYHQSQIGRYQGAGNHILYDTKTGKIYQSGELEYEIDD
jgi:hypothetical protein